MSRLLRQSYLLVVLGLIAICGGAIYLGTVLDDGDAGVRPDPVERSDGSLAQEPPPLTLADVKQQPKDSPSAAVMEVWYWGQWGGLENALALYDPEVVDAVGVSDMRGALSARRAYLVSAQPRIVDEFENSDGTVTVTVYAYRKNAPPEPHSFTLVRRDGEWLVSFDNMLESAIAQYVELENMPDPGATGDEIPASAKRAGLAAARAFRNAGKAND